MLAALLFRQVVREGTLTVVDAAGKSETFGRGEPRVTVRLHDRATEYKLLTNPKLHLGEAYMDGRLTVEDGSLYDFLELAGRNVVNVEQHPLWGMFDRVGRALRPIQTFNPVSRARRNVAHHYDLSGELYDLFLDSDRQYSCAYFTHPDNTLEQAQHDKKRHIAAKLRLDRPGLSVLDIGSGWGGLGLYLANTADAQVTGLTLSDEQIKLSRERARKAGLDGRVDFKLEDYRNLSGRFDRIVSVGMFEHVGTAHYPEFFRTVRDRLADDGVALLHSIGRMDPPGGTNPWLRKYIFPGGYTPALSEVLAVVERTGLWVTDIEILRLHYAETLRAWRERFMANRDRVKDLYDERFCRMWEFYLAGCEVSFRHMGQMVFQMQLARRQDAVPLTRDYITDWERAQAAPQEAVAAE
ncbi:cyclopropane-fatty-acyl-phospholipid synthase [Limimonas halophila]|uniref:Cyclopropane-fatty-acyl-phospholipid synthase n=1 Tax=Limimonas halophila TaxID=1082479 RepID=A0A1G7MEG1_9PROT|nr:cyclopropane-fatty-acyl-phospholipid synthase family protein [Limimonas halophila]SDF60056.1 cyclopropane-fatty-acyl-phospholipid synthase [Limimonas halophila]